MSVFLRTLSNNFNKQYKMEFLICGSNEKSGRKLHGLIYLATCTQSPVVRRVEKRTGCEEQIILIL